MSEIPRCQAKVWHRDTYRRTGRGKSGFEMHYNQEQCKRRAINGSFCRQHADLRARWGDQFISICPWASPYMDEKA